MSQTSFPENDALPVGTRLGEFEIERVVGIGGFGIVYLAMDHALQRRVALKEYMPSALAARGSGTEQVSIRSQSHAETFGIGLRSFVNEARLLAKFDNPSLVKVHRFWEANGTAYMVMPYYQGVTLKDARPALGGAPSEAWLRTMLDSILGALDVIHHEQIFHRDVSPPNIMLVGSPAWANPRELKPVLLDFGAARHVIGDRTQTLTAILNPSFAPIEQYAESTALRQGPWTDLYALAGVLYFCLTGRPPVQAAARTIHDELRPLGAQQATLRSAEGQPYELDFLRAIDWCLSVKPNQRPENVAALREVLEGRRAVPDHVLANEAQSGAAPAPAAMGHTAFPPTQPAPSAYARTEADMPTRVMPPTQPPTQPPAPAPAASATVPPAAAVPTPAPAAPVAPTAPAAAPAKPAAAPAVGAAPASTGGGRGIGIGVAAVAVAAVLGVGAWKFMGGHGSVAEPGAPAASVAESASAVAVPAASAVEPVVAVSAANPVGAQASAPAATAGVTPPATTPAVPAQPPQQAPQPVAGRKPGAPGPGYELRRGAEAARPHAAEVPAEPIAQPPAAQPAQHAAPATPATPSAEGKGPEACSKRVLFSYDLCMTRECKKPEYINLPQCARFKDKPVDPTSVN
ncbi:serine/threonine protein kinase [Aquabacterium sp.]|uniref:serine/threonine protein kinase n=1 Tax=Aquabacterium sp. TaxID=1872578 RepID=UPI0035B4771C